VSESAHSSSSPLFEKGHRAFLLRKLHSLSGVVPVGGFMVFHLWTNAKATQGQESFDAAVRDISHLPFVTVVEFALILLPLAFHMLDGIWLALSGKPNVGRYTYSRNWMYTLQRVSGLIAAVFIVLHLKDYWYPKMAGTMEPSQFYPALCANMSATTKGVPIAALWYVFGIAACVFHFANGLWGFCFSWGITVSRRSQRMAATVFGLVGLVVFFIGANTAIYFATGESVPDMASRLFGREVPAQQSCRDVLKLSER
jgi:succinate dehydrogenase/fumarate reductase cytochrome b subunit (b558 family)